MTPRPFSFTPRRAVMIVSAGLGLILLGYVLFVSLPLIEGPSFSILEPQTPVVEGITKISGTTKRVAFLEINGEPIPLSEEGKFAVYRAYPAGYTALVIKARDRFGREKTETVTFITDNKKQNEEYGEEKN